MKVRAECGVLGTRGLQMALDEVQTARTIARRGHRRRFDEELIDEPCSVAVDVVLELHDEPVPIGR